MDKVSNAIEAGEVRGICIRFLESYPDHPGLLLLRGLTEAASSDCDETLIGQSFFTAHRNALERYSIPQTEVEENLIRIANFASDRWHNNTGPLMYTTIRISEEFDIHQDLVTKIHELSDGNKDEMASRIYKYYTFRMIFDRVTPKITELCEHYAIDTKRYNE